MKKYILTLLFLFGCMASFADEAKKSETPKFPLNLHGTYYIRASTDEHFDVFLRYFAKLSHVSIKVEKTTSGTWDDIYLEVDGESDWVEYYTDGVIMRSKTHAQICVGWVQ